MKTYYIMSIRRTKDNKAIKNGKWHHSATIKTLENVEAARRTCSNGYYKYKIVSGNHYDLKGFDPEDINEAMDWLAELIKKNQEGDEKHDTKRIR